MIAQLITSILPSAFGVIDKLVTDKDQAIEIKSELQKQLMVNDAAALETQASVILAEANGQSWLQRNWRPVLMLVCIIIVANTYIIAPYAALMFGAQIEATLDDNIWKLMLLGVGGYIPCRTAEKIFKNR